MSEKTTYDEPDMTDIMLKEAGIKAGAKLNHTEEELKALYGDKKSFDVTISRMTTIKEFAKVTVDAYLPEDAGSIVWTSEGKADKPYDWVESERTTLYDKIETIRELPNDQGQGSGLTIPKIKAFLDENGADTFVMSSPADIHPVTQNPVHARKYEFTAKTNGAKLMELFKIVDGKTVGLYTYHTNYIMIGMVE